MFNFVFVPPTLLNSSEEWLKCYETDLSGRIKFKLIWLFWNSWLKNSIKHQEIVVHSLSSIFVSSPASTVSHYANQQSWQSAIMPVSHHVPPLQLLLISAIISPSISLSVINSSECLYRAYHPSSLLAIKPINQQAYWLLVFFRDF